MAIKKKTTVIGSIGTQSKLSPLSDNPNTSWISAFGAGRNEHANHSGHGVSQTNLAPCALNVGLFVSSYWALRLLTSLVFFIQNELF